MDTDFIEHLTDLRYFPHERQLTNQTSMVRTIQRAPD